MNHQVMATDETGVVTFDGKGSLAGLLFVGKLQNVDDLRSDRCHRRSPPVRPKPFRRPAPAELDLDRLSAALNRLSGPAKVSVHQILQCAENRFGRIGVQDLLKQRDAVHAAQNFPGDPIYIGFPTFVLRS